MPLSLSSPTAAPHPAAGAFTHRAAQYGLAATDLGRALTIGGRRLRITGWHDAVSGGAVEVTDVATGMVWCLHVASVADALKDEPPLAP